MDKAKVIEHQHYNLDRAVEQYRELISRLEQGERPGEACYFFDQCVIGRIAESVVSAFDQGYIVELEERIVELEQQLKARGN